MADGRAVLEQWLAALNRNDAAAARQLLDDDYVDEMPQSGERVRGPENWIAILEHYPNAELMVGGVDLAGARVIGDDDRWVMTPTFNVLSVEGTGNRYAVVARVRYPDGTMWHVINFVTIRAGKIARTTQFFAPEYDPPGLACPMG